MPNKKTLIVIFSIICAYFVFAIIFFGLDNFKNKFQDLFIMLDSGDKWQFQDGKWIDVTDEDTYNWQKYNIYIDNKLYGNYDIFYNDNWYIFDSNRNNKQYDGNFIAIKGNKKYDIIDYEKQDFDSNGKSKLIDILKQENMTFQNKYNYAEKISLDIDGDNELENIYTISNAFVEDLKDYFSVAFIEDKDIQILYEDYNSTGNSYDMCVPKVDHIIDIDSDSKYEIIMECVYYSVIGSCDSLYQKQGGKYKIVKGCKED